ncbi:MAG: TetR/AcrR family transcriptional regulator [Proteobacteria bacterium]|nr:TetR/AcrR family transcriptional regulator [Pseudomonadota bacterium]MBU4295997.1 TetR/AcrR family transcriptional regulator [Pseudomonadota bacterium]MCG2747248.1 TetR/AcrR family transcriptional regulator [Desulfobulbaceae bacterium]
MENLQQLARTTFSNLPVEKQEKIVAAAVREFSRHGYKKASINTIVRDAGISKGSLYQYFHNKEVLFVFIFERFTLLVKKAVAEQGRSNVARAREGESATAEQGRSSIVRARDGESTTAAQGRSCVVGAGPEHDFFSQVGRVLLAGIEFIDRHPDYFQIYLRVLFEQDVPMREKLLAQVRLFSREYFGPLCQAGQKSGAIRSDIPLAVVIFILDATLDRFLQSYAQGALDRDLDLGQINREELLVQVKLILQVLKEGLAVYGNSGNRVV